MTHPALAAPDSRSALIALLHRIGGRVAEEELQRQIDRHGIGVSDMLGDLHDLESEGLVHAVLLFELTEAGRTRAREPERAAA